MGGWLYPLSIYCLSGPDPSFVPSLIMEMDPVSISPWQLAQCFPSGRHSRDTAGGRISLPGSGLLLWGPIQGLSQKSVQQTSISIHPHQTAEADSIWVSEMSQKLPSQHWPIFTTEECLTPVMDSHWPAVTQQTLHHHPHLLPLQPEFQFVLSLDLLPWASCISYPFNLLVQLIIPYMNHFLFKLLCAFCLLIGPWRIL